MILLGKRERGGPNKLTDAVVGVGGGFTSAPKCITFRGNRGGRRHHGRL